MRDEQSNQGAKVVNGKGKPKPSTAPATEKRLQDIAELARRLRHAHLAECA